MGEIKHPEGFFGLPHVENVDRALFGPNRGVFLGAVDVHSIVDVRGLPLKMLGLIFGSEVDQTHNSVLLQAKGVGPGSKTDSPDLGVELGVEVDRRVFDDVVQNELFVNVSHGELAVVPFVELQC